MLAAAHAPGSDPELHTKERSTTNCSRLGKDLVGGASFDLERICASKPRKPRESRNSSLTFEAPKQKGQPMIRPMTRILVVPVLGLLRPVKGVKPSTKIVGRRRRRPALIGLGAVGVAVVVAGCGSAASTSSTPAQTPVAPAATVNTQAAAPARAPAPTATPAAAATPTPKATPTPPATKVSTQAAAPAKAPATAAAGAPAAATPTQKATPTAPAAPAAKNPDAGIPQGNSGDADPDNNGGANDGDGSI